LFSQILLRRREKILTVPAERAGKMPKTIFAVGGKVVAARLKTRNKIGKKN